MFISVSLSCFLAVYAIFHPVRHGVMQLLRGADPDVVFGGLKIGFFLSIALGLKLQIDKPPKKNRFDLKKKKKARAKPVASARVLEEPPPHYSLSFPLWSGKQRHHRSVRKPNAVIMFVGENRLN